MRGKRQWLSKHVAPASRTRAQRGRRAQGVTSPRGPLVDVGLAVESRGRVRHQRLRSIGGADPFCRRGRGAGGLGESVGVPVIALRRMRASSRWSPGGSRANWLGGENRPSLAARNAVTHGVAHHVSAYWATGDEPGQSRRQGGPGVFRHRRRQRQGQATRPHRPRRTGAEHDSGQTAGWHCRRQGLRTHRRRSAGISRRDAPDRSDVLELGAVSNQASRHVPIRGRSRRGLA